MALIEMRRDASGYSRFDALDGIPLVEKEVLLIAWPDGVATFQRVHLAREGYSTGETTAVAWSEIEHHGHRVPVLLRGLDARRPHDEPCRLHGLGLCQDCDACHARFA